MAQYPSRDITPAHVPWPEHYALSRAVKASTRLNFQHWIFKEHWGYLVHPAVQHATSCQPYLVADIGTGTGIWSIELSQQLQAQGITSKIYGFDISASQFPSPNLVPNNVFLRQHDTFTPYPEEFKGMFDLIHIRGFVSIVSPSNIEAFMSCVTALLKPGGFLQWTDVNPSESTIVHVVEQSTVSTVELERSLALYKMLKATEVFTCLEKHGKSHGLTLQCQQKTPFRNSALPTWNQNEVMALEDFFLRPAKESGDSQRIQDEEQRIGRFMQESEAGAYISPGLFTVVMQKSS